MDARNDGEARNPIIAALTRWSFGWFWLVLRWQFREGIDLKARVNCWGRPCKSGGPPLFAPSLKVQRDVAHNSRLRTAVERASTA
jgi:hypothetical protein